MRFDPKDWNYWYAPCRLLSLDLFDAAMAIAGLTRLPHDTVRKLARDSLSLYFDMLMQEYGSISIGLQYLSEKTFKILAESNLVRWDQRNRTILETWVRYVYSTSHLENPWLAYADKISDLAHAYSTTGSDMIGLGETEISRFKDLRRRWCDVSEQVDTIYPSDITGALSVWDDMVLRYWTDEESVALGYANFRDTVHCTCWMWTFMQWMKEWVPLLDPEQWQKIESVARTEAERRGASFVALTNLP